MFDDMPGRAAELAPPPPLLDDDQALAYVQGVQLAVVRQLTLKSYVPEDAADKAVLMKALEGLSRNALTSKRIKSDEAAAAGLAAGGATIIAELLKQVSHRYGNTTSTMLVMEAPMLGPEIPDPVLLPGEVDQGHQQLEFSSFMSAMKR